LVSALYFFFIAFTLGIVYLPPLFLIIWSLGINHSIFFIVCSGENIFSKSTMFLLSRKDSNAILKTKVDHVLTYFADVSTLSVLM
jgi:hypothetical protein